MREGYLAPMRRSAMTEQSGRQFKKLGYETVGSEIDANHISMIFFHFLAPLTSTYNEPFVARSCLVFNEIPSYVKHSWPYRK